ncbi:MAG TPA: NAD(P)H-quinone oxidoreductase [Jiangellaceae bacterium]|jgi:putative PIG3 family NAD(P)H quinone oxidoreductase|nr:NAD(P)H-quinone oxidoreductase [Jiangellaceae bacterium]
MRAVVINNVGGPEVLTWSEVPDPQARQGEVVLDVAASAVNRADLLQRQGHYPPPPNTSAWPGLECSGTVSEIGSGVIGWAVGDQACALLSGGGYAEKVAVPVGQLLPIPRGLDMVTAAALPEVTCTVWFNVFMTAGLRPREVLLVHGGAGGVGTMAIQLGKAVGATVAATAGSDEKLARCGALGATILVNYHNEDFVSVVQDATDGHGADVILDIVGAKNLERNLAALAPAGRLVIIGLQGGRTAELDLSVLMGKGAAIIGTLLRSRSATEKAIIVAAVREHVWPLVESGDVRPVVDRVLPMTSASEAHRVVEAGEHVGKVVLTA